MAEIQIERVQPQDEEIREEWARVTNEKDILGVCVARMSSEDWPWHVSIYVAEFIRTEPLQSELFDSITAALTNVAGVTRVVHEDREVWVLQGEPAGEKLIHACSAALETLAPSLRKAYAAL